MKPRHIRILCLTPLLAFVLLSGGCAGAFRVHPWDRDLLAEKKMSFNPNPVLTAIDDHIYFSKEGATGGLDVAGGGCGCN